MLKIGCTGGIGSGKSTVCKYLENTLNVPVYYMDDRAKELVNEKPQLKFDLIEHYGPETFIDGVYNTKHISDIIFENPEERKWIEHKIGEYMKADYEEWLVKCKQKNYPYVIMESAIFFETKCTHFVDFILGVMCPYALRLERVQKRNNFTTEQVIQRMKNQMDEDEKMGLCDFHVFNGDIDVADLHFELLGLDSIFRKIGEQLQNKEKYYKKLIAQGVAYGIAVGQSSISTVDLFLKQNNSEPDKEFIMSTVDAFFDEFGVK